jgi:heme oxygenase
MSGKGQEAWEAISKGISDSIVKENMDLIYKNNELKRYIRHLEAKVAVLERGFQDLGKSVGGGGSCDGVDELSPWY